MGSLLDFFQKNFLHVAPILAAGGFAIAILLERVPALLWRYPLARKAAFFEKIRDLVMADRISEAVAVCESQRTKLAARVVREGLLRAHLPEPLIEDELQIAVSEAVQSIQKRVQFLSTIANVATLLGLLGTIIGLIHSFEAVGTASAQQRSALLAAGISTAMNSTMLGLAVAIPCMVAFSYLMNKINSLTEEVDQAAVRTLAMIRQRFYSTGVESAGSQGSAGNHSASAKAHVA
jgi:biopolymer transport protein ExbB